MRSCHLSCWHSLGEGVRVTEAWEPRKWLKRASAETAAAQYAELSSKLLALPRRGSACDRGVGAEEMVEAR
jgi:hypothetical protein